MKAFFCLLSLALLSILQISYAEEALLKIEVQEKPDKCPRKTKIGDSLAMHYTGRLKDGKKFDSSHDRGKTFDFTLGKGMVIKGWEQGLLDMCVGEKRKLTIPPHLGYGDNGAGATIPPGATLYMEVELVEIKDSNQAHPDVFGMIDKDKNSQLTQEEIKTYLTEQDSMPNDDPASHDTIVSEIFQEEDKNKDGVISFEEFSGPKHSEL